MVIVLHTCLVLSLPSEMWISVFHNLVDNDTRDWDGIKRSLGVRTLLLCLWCRDTADQSRGMLAYWCLRWIENILSVPSANFSFFLWGVPQGSRHSPTIRLSIAEMSAQSRPCCPFVFILRVLHALNKQQEQRQSAAQLVSAENHCTTSAAVFFDLFDCFAYQVTCSTVAMGGHADQ